jgi:hypothetical protein
VAEVVVVLLVEQERMEGVEQEGLTLKSKSL